MLFSLKPTTALAVLLAATLAAGVPAAAQSSSSSSSSSSGSLANPPDRQPLAPHPRVTQPEAGGAAVTLETSEPLFDLAVALNACGYDADLAASVPVRGKVREEVNQVLASGTPEARDHRDALCKYINDHQLTGAGLNIAQYISLSLYLNPPPQLTPSVGENEMPPDSTQVVNILPLLRTFAEDINLHSIWLKYRPEYEALVDEVHTPLTKTVLDTTLYLKLPISSYDGRRFLVLLEPMLAPSTTNARIYGNDYIVVASPNAEGKVHMDQVRHTYLHYEVEPLVYARASAMDRFLPLLKTVQDAPLDFNYKSDVAALLTECMIKAIEALTMDVGVPKPVKPTQVRQRVEMTSYEANLAAWEHEADIIRRKQVEKDKRQGYILAGYFYDQIGQMSRDGVSLREEIAPMVYGMDVDRERRAALQIEFLDEGSSDFVKRAPRQLQGMDLAEMKLMKNDVTGAEMMAEEALKANPNDARAHYLAGRIELMHGDPGAATDHFNKTLTLTKDPRTLAWTHIYLGRLYDVARAPAQPEADHPERQKALAEYKAALAVRDSQPDTRAAAEKGLKEPFLLPKRAQDNEDNEPLDPTGKAEKQAYRPDSPR